MADNALSGLKSLPTWGKWAIGIGGLGAVYFAYKQHTNSSAAGSASTGNDPLTGMPYSQDNSIDPLTGQTYLAEAQQYGSVSAAEAAYSSYNGSALGSYGPGVPASSYYTSNGGTTTGTGVSYPDNATWSQAVEAGLSDIGYSQTDVAAALGRYLGRLSLTPAQAQIIYAALAEYGNPPSGSYQVVLAPSTPPNPKTFPPRPQVEVPNVAGFSQVQAEQVLNSEGLKAAATKETAPKGSVYIVHSTSPKAGTRVNPGSTVTLHASVRK